MKNSIYLFLTVFSLYACTSQENTSNKKSIWIANALNTIKSNQFPRIKAISWWNENWNTTLLRIDSSPESNNAYKNGVASDFFKTNLAFNNNKLMAPTSGVYHNAFPDFGGEEDIVTAARIDNFETLANKEIGWAYFSNNWLDNLVFPYDDVTTIHNAGKTPFIRMMARTNFVESHADPVYTMQNIIDGNFDTQLNAWANEAKNIGYPLLVEFGTEANGNWFPWNGVFNGGATTDGYGDPNLADGPEHFRDAYRHIIDIFNANNVTNITWFFHVDAHGFPNENWNRIENYYPGDAYIDWVGISVYGPFEANEDLESFATILEGMYPSLTALTNKPLAILEFGITEI